MSTVSPPPEGPPPRLHALVLGATGAVGRSLVSELLRSDAWDKVTTMGRRKVVFTGVEGATESDDVPPHTVHPKLVQVIVNFEDLDESTEAFEGHDWTFCCLGSTIAAAGSQEAFRHIDYDYVLNAAAHYHKHANGGHFSYVSSIGADPATSNFYLKTKGDVEAALGEVGFDRLAVFRPSLLITPREGESRFGESVAQAVFPWISWAAPKDYKEIKVETVARAIRRHAEIARGWSSNVSPSKAGCKVFGRDPKPPAASGYGTTATGSTTDPKSEVFLSGVIHEMAKM
eukprot:TRINITY_DN9435_c0_g1_i1.p1 TRINITY_DN9435_c0_g1~~TRINITY_DN9435_c0_g1_i1.p1  ORF type:complete len:287 (+),score=45.20 TRINITY_DN9435_c0_g1_i1:103-963(+)